MLVKVTESKKEAWSSYLDASLPITHQGMNRASLAYVWTQRYAIPIDIELHKAGLEEMLGKHLDAP